MSTVRLLLAATLLATSVSAAAVDQGSRDSLDAYFRAHVAGEKIPGMVVGIVDGGDEWVHAYGLADVENQTAMKIDSSFRLASITKTMTAVAILQLVERGKIDLDAEVQTYVPYFPRKKWPVTVRHLLGHLAGIPHYVNRAAEQHIKEHKSTRESVAIFENFDLVAEPGTKWSYSSYGYNLLGAVIEQASGQSYGDYMRANIFAPLGMTSTRLDDPIALIPNRVRGYQLIDGQLANSEFIDISSRFAAGGLRTTVPDLLRFARGLMSGKLITPEHFELLATPMQTRDGKLTGYGMGVFVHPAPGVSDTGGRFAISNNGGQQETRTFLMMFPKRGVAFATAMNAEINTGVGEVMQIAQVVFGEPFDFRPTAATRADRVVLTAMHAVFSFGSADLEQHAVAPAGRASEAEALRYFASIVNDAAKGESEKALLERIDAGREPGPRPGHGQPLVVLGRAMATALHADYASKGAPIFFRDYAASHRGVLPRWLATHLDQYARDWSEATPPSVRELEIGPQTDVGELARVLRPRLAGRLVVPNLASRIADQTASWTVAGDARASAAADLAVELFPGSSEAHRAAAIALAARGDVTAARAALQRAVALAPDADDIPGLLNNLAYGLAGAGHLERAIDLLAIATESFPRVANLFDSLGELAAKAGQHDRAVAAYERAIAIDPNLKSSQAALAKLRNSQ